MENERTENIFYLDLKHVHKYGCAKFSPIRCFLHNKQPLKVRRKKKNKKKKQKKKVGKPIGDPVGGRDAPITATE